jgi:hypothetical protein
LLRRTLRLYAIALAVNKEAVFNVLKLKIRKFHLNAGALKASA